MLVLGVKVGYSTWQQMKALYTTLAGLASFSLSSPERETRNHTSGSCLYWDGGIKGDMMRQSLMDEQV